MSSLSFRFFVITLFLFYMLPDTIPTMRTTSVISLVLFVLGISCSNAQEVMPNCTSVGVPFCFTHNDYPCAKYCESLGETATTCEILSTSDYRTECNCSGGSGCKDEEFDPEESPTCESIQIWDCSNACLNLCKSFKPVRDTQCTDYDGVVTCICDGVPACDDKIGLSGVASQQLVVAFGMIISASLLLSL